jgi:hypothetical protein
MQTFKDNAGRTWTPSINVTSVKQVRQLLKVDLLDIVDGKLIEELISDPVKLTDVIYVLCKEEADKRKISDEDFGRAMGGDAIDRATAALLEELANFSRNPERRKLMQKAIEKYNRVESAMMEKANERLDQINEEELMESLLKDSSGNSPE